MVFMATVKRTLPCYCRLVSSLAEEESPEETDFSLQYRFIFELNALTVLMLSLDLHLL